MVRYTEQIEKNQASSWEDMFKNKSMFRGYGV